MAFEGAAVAVAVLLVVTELVLGEKLVFLGEHLTILYTKIAHRHLVLGRSVGSQLFEVGTDIRSLLWTNFAYICAKLNA